MSNEVEPLIERILRRGDNPAVRISCFVDNPVTVIIFGVIQDGHIDMLNKLIQTSKEK